MTVQAKQHNDKVRVTKTEKPFPSGVNSDREKSMSPRDDAVVDLAARFEKRRQEQITESEQDPEILAKKKALEMAAGARDLDPGTAVSEEDNLSAEGIATREIISNQGAVEAEHSVQNVAELPASIAKHVEINKDGKAVVKMNVDGKVKYVPFDDFISGQQKYEAGDNRMREAVEWSKQLQQKEIDLNTKIVNTENKTEVVQEQDDFDVKQAANGVAKAMFDGTLEQAGKTLEDAFIRLRQPTKPVQDVSSIVNTARKAAKEEYAKEHHDDQVSKAWKNFTKEYSDVVGDEDAFAFADAITGKIAKENSDWDVSQVMTEAGNRARAKIIDPAKQLAERLEPLPSDLNRQAAKENLTQFPHAQNNVLEKVQDEKPQTPREVLAEIRAGRNQP